MRFHYLNTFRLATLCFLTLCISTFALKAQVLFDNGPIFNSTGTGAGGANESVLYTTTFGMSTIGFGHQSASFNRIADDFTISDCSWRIDSIVFFGYQTGSGTTSTFTGVNFRIWDSIPDAAGASVVFGDTSTNRMTASRWSGVYRITETTVGATTRPIMRNVCAVTGLTLQGGTFWIDWASTGSLASGPWAQARTPIGVAITGNGRQRIGSAWNNAVDGGTNTPAQGFPFIIYGTVLDPVVDAGADQATCAGNTVMIGGSPAASGGQGPLSLLWSPGGSLSDSTIGQPMATPASSTTYVLAVTDSTGCTVMDTVMVTIGTVPSNFLPADTTICGGDSITLDAGAASSYLWSTGDTNQTISASAGTYFVSALDSMGCAASDTVVISNPVGVSILGDSSFCDGDSLQLSCSIVGSSYTWSNGGSGASTMVSAAGTYSVTVVDQIGCSSTASTTVSTSPAPTAQFSNFVSGGGLVYTFSDMSLGSPTSWAWSFGDGNVSTTPSPVHTYAASGSYVVVLVVSNACGSDTLVQNFTVVTIDGSLAGSSIEISPNPAASSFEIAVDGMESGALEISLIDLQGKVQAQYQIADAAQGVREVVDASKLARGTYFVRLRSANAVEMRKVVLE